MVIWQASTKNNRHTQASVTMLAVLFLAGVCHAGNAYKSTGQFGEVRYSQLPPINAAFEQVRVHHLNPAQPDRRSVCQYLTSNLQTLQTGGEVYEVSATGDRVLLSSEQIHNKIIQIRQAITEHCYD
ncbi:hypothetical protein SAMN02745664_11278 [Moraxella cuniculi DSM 21768]|uniref:DUF4124 domain-containing protein n=1 Tax=Moraxella cuniculi DSM 21768 TaxID=1122245 RepID=A0A1N7FFK3_9GAMM|nr:hypothetical protein [Moraxella cuniculi]OOS06998.1 hypothetical protein B0189_04155 [Moraxella cuniculi]SIR99097.1 hypothetical protein SAMN02745664_11278 [Moraxella cuniculi DSM 21768]